MSIWLRINIALWVVVLLMFAVNFARTKVTQVLITQDEEFPLVYVFTIDGKEKYWMQRHDFEYLNIADIRFFKRLGTVHLDDSVRLEEKVSR